MKLKIVAIFLLLGAVIYSCISEEPAIEKTVYLDLPDFPYDYKQQDVGNHVPTLGRVLFYDRQLSVNGSVSCASCHKQSAAFSDNVAFSRGFDTRLTNRNSMPIQNLGSPPFFFGMIEPNTDPRLGSPLSSSVFVPGGFFGQAFFWDGRETNLAEMVLKPIGNHIEMGIRDVDNLTAKLSEIPYYKTLFANAYGTPEITSEKIAKALASFVKSIESKNTKMDRVMLQRESLSALEKKGRDLFFTTYDCNSCHQIQNPHGYIMAGTFANIGLDARPQDTGLGATTQRKEDAGKFKIPSLRNVTLTAPYMHDGRFQTLDEVLDHYSSGIQDDENLDLRLKRSGAPMRMNIPDHDKTAIIAFLHTLTDYDMILDPKFSNPFKVQ